MNKKISSFILAGLMLFMSSAFAEGETEEKLASIAPSVMELTIGDNNFVIDGDMVIESDVAPCIINDITMVPLRSIFESLGASVQWDAETKTVYALKEDSAVVLQIGQSVMFVNGIRVDMDAPSVIMSDRTMIPFRSVASAYGYEVQYDEQTNKVTITK
ncbi:MAG: copper amine oxidase N-terminal domain-containing protein [Clostridia bacterium]|nr:copper amine oxidase N-terminal domain-containing protein [Clostridia bacterium]